MGITLEELRQMLRRELSPVCVSPEQTAAEVSRILHFLTGRTASEVYAYGEESVPDGSILQAKELIHNRVEKRIPLQYLLHQADFYGLNLYVNPYVLIPRPETELLVERALTAGQEFQRRQGRMPRILDLCTGSGAIALAVSHALQAEVTATDISPEALRVARINQRKLGTQVVFKQGDLFEAVAGERFDLILCNPPYVDPALKPTLTPEVLYQEPHLALFPADGNAYAFYERLARDGGHHLNPGGQMLVEVGEGMAEKARALFSGCGFADGEILDDYAGIGRIVSVRWRSSSGTT